MNQLNRISLYHKKLGFSFIYSSLFLLMICIFSMPLSSCSSTKKLSAQTEVVAIRNSVEQLVHCYNKRDTDCLIQLFDPAYQSWSPVIQPENIPNFVRHSVRQFEKNDFEIKVQINEIEAGVQFAHVALRWTIFYKENRESKNPPVDVNRIDIWKKAAKRQWRLYRTVIYTEKRF